MYLSIFTDELGLDVEKSLPRIAQWDLDHVDLRGRVFGKGIECQSREELEQLQGLLWTHRLKVGCLQTSLAKVHLPGRERQQAEAEKLEGIIRAAEALDCRLVRAFFYWQPGHDRKGQLAVEPDQLQRVLDMFGPLARRAQEAGLTLGFENCGVTCQEVITVVDALDIPGWGLAWDVRNEWQSEASQDDAAAYFNKAARRAVMVHVKAKGAIEAMGEQLLPWDQALAACDAAGLEGPVSVETHSPEDQIERSRAVVRAVQQAWPSAAPGAGVPEAGTSIENVTREYADDPVGFVVVGLGMGHNRAQAIVKTPGTRLVGVCDLDEQRARRTGEVCDVQWTTELDPWLQRDDVEAVFVVTETGNHAKVALQALQAGKHVLTTKPMEASVEACDQVIAEADAGGLLLGVDFNRRFMTVTTTLKAALEQEAIGTVLNGECSLKIRRTEDYFKHNGGWRGTWALDGGGVLSNQAIHHIDELAYTLGIPQRVRAQVWTQKHQIECEDLGSAIWEYADGAVITFTATSTYFQPTWFNRVELNATRGAYFRAGGGIFDGNVEKWFLGDKWSDTPPRRVEPQWLNAMDNFAAAIRTGAPLVATGRDGRATQSVLAAMYRSATREGGDWVTVQPAGAAVEKA